MSYQRYAVVEHEPDSQLANSLTYGYSGAFKLEGRKVPLSN